MAYPSHEELEAMAVRLEDGRVCSPAQNSCRNGYWMLQAAAMLRACKGRDAEKQAYIKGTQSGWNAAIEAAALTAFDCVFYDSVGSGFDEDKFNTAIDALKKGQTND